MAPVTDPPRESDEQLLELVAAGDTGAHRSFFERHYHAVFAFVKRRLSDPEHAEEVVADVFFEVWRSAAQFRGESRVTSWLFGIAHYKAMVARRHRSSAKRASVIPTKVETLHRVADPRRSEDALAARETLRQVRLLIEKLPANQREIVELAWLEQKDYREIAARLRIPEATVKTRIMRARARLRAGLRSPPAGAAP